MNTFFIAGNVPSSKNSRVWTGKFFIASKQTTKWRKETEALFIKYKDDFLKAITDLPKPYIIKFTFVRGTKHKFDYINPMQTIQDEMVKHGWLEDDNADELLPVIDKYQYSKDNPGVLIEVL